MTAEAGRSRTVEANPVAVAGWLEVDRLSAQNRDLLRRIDRTLDYLGEVARATQSAITAQVALACIKSLEAPAALTDDSTPRGGAA